MNLHQLAMLFTAGCVFVIASCSAGHPPTTPVSGVLLHHGKAVSNASINFTPEKGRPANGVTDAEGHFRLTTFQSGDGALAGEHLVTITYIGQDVSPIPPRYSDPRKSDLRVQIASGEEHELQLELVD